MSPWMAVGIELFMAQVFDECTTEEMRLEHGRGSKLDLGKLSGTAGMCIAWDPESGRADG